MRLKMLVGLSGPAFSLKPGDEHEFDDRVAIRHIEAGHAVPVAGAMIETATVVAPEARPARPRKSKG